MSKLETIDGKATNWCGLWWHPEYNGFSSEAINLAQLKKFKGTVRLYVRKNKYYNGGENGRPNYNFCLKDAQAEEFKNIVFLNEQDEDQPYQEDGVYYTEDGDRLYTGDEVRRIIEGTAYDVERGYSAGDILPSDFV